MTSSTRTVLLDSSVWIEILGSGPLSKTCQKELISSSSVIVPTLVLFEVYKKIAAMTSEDRALSATAALSQYQVKELTSEIALSAADLSLEYRLGMADSLILAHAREASATLITLDNDFAELPGTKVLRKS